LSAFGQAPIKWLCVGNKYYIKVPGRDNQIAIHFKDAGNSLAKLNQVGNFWGKPVETLLRKGDFPYWNEPQFQEVKGFAPDILNSSMPGNQTTRNRKTGNCLGIRQDYFEYDSRIQENDARRRQSLCDPSSAKSPRVKILELTSNHK